ncbi:MAG: DUF6441 family protein [Methylocystis sp.]|uniref:DUF6441 family protein n=1 Tax=Methylocystis sp. TaxID=1911079 RepID=UPI003D14FE10
MFSFEFDKNAISRALDEERVALTKRVRLATEGVGRQQLVDPLRSMTRSAFNSTKLPTTWRGKVFPEALRETLTPAFFAYSKAPQIVQAFEEGAEIVAHKGKFLAIPTPDAGVRRSSVKNKALTPAIWEQETGAKLRFLPLKNGNGLLVADGRYRRQSARARLRKSFKPIRTRIKGESPSIVVFFLVKQVRLKKRLDIAGIAERAGAKYSATYERAANNP